MLHFKVVVVVGIAVDMGGVFNVLAVSIDPNLVRNPLTVQYILKISIFCFTGHCAGALVESLLGTSNQNFRFNENDDLFHGRLGMGVLTLCLGQMAIWVCKFSF